MSAPSEYHPENYFRYRTTMEVMAAAESWAWNAAEYAADGITDDSIAIARIFHEDAKAELARRERLRHHPLAPAWPDASDEARRVKAAAVLSDLIERWTGCEFRRAGRELLARCPFPDHADASPSFYVNNEKGVWHCWGCQRGGDVYHFALEWLGCRTFADALDLVARAVGVERRVGRDTIIHDSRPYNGGVNHEPFIVKRGPAPPAAFVLRGGKVVRR